MTPQELLQSSSTLPTKPVDVDGRPVSWIWVTGAPGFHYADDDIPEGVWIDVDAAWIDERIATFQRLTSRGYAVPVLAEHKANGERKGDVLQLASFELPDGPSLIAAVAWADASIPDKIKSGAIKYFSPQLRNITDDAGQKHLLALTELSLVSKPHQKRLPSHVLASEETNTMADPIANASAPGTPSVEDRITALEGGFNDIKTAIAGLTAAVSSLAPKTEPEAETLAEPDAAAPVEEKPATEEPKPDSIAMREIGDLKRQLAEERTARRRAEFSRSYPAGSIVELTPALQDVMFEMAEKAPNAFKALAKSARRKGDTGERDNPALPPRRSDIDVEWGVSLGEAAGRPNVGAGGFSLAEASDEEIDAEATRRHPGDSAAQLRTFKVLMSERAALNKSK